MTVLGTSPAGGQPPCRAWPASVVVVAVEDASAFVPRSGCRRSRTSGSVGKGCSAGAQPGRLAGLAVVHVAVDRANADAPRDRLDWFAASARSGSQHFQVFGRSWLRLPCAAMISAAACSCALSDGRRGGGRHPRHRPEEVDPLRDRVLISHGRCSRRTGGDVAVPARRRGRGVVRIPERQRRRSGRDVEESRGSRDDGPPSRHRGRRGDGRPADHESADGDDSSSNRRRSRTPDAPDGTTACGYLYSSQGPSGAGRSDSDCRYIETGTGHPSVLASNDG